MTNSKAIAKRLVEDVLNQGNMHAFDAIFADDYVNHTMPVPEIPGNKAGFRQLVLATRQAFPDVHVHVENMVCEGDFVVFNDHVEATSRGAFMGVPATGKRVTWTEIHFLKIARDQIVEHWSNFDQLGILKQLGTIA